jgi:hypothetical protein
MSMLLVSRVSAGASGGRESRLSSLWHRLHQALTERVPFTQRDRPLGDLAYDVDAALMLFQRRERGIHALQPGGRTVSPVTAAC